MSFAILDLVNGRPGAIVRENIHVCRGCLATDIKLYSLHEKRLHQAFIELTGILVSNGVVCCVCLHLLRKFQSFRQRCHNVDSILQQVQNDNDTEINLIDRKLISDLDPNLTTTVPFHTDFPPAYNIPLLGDDDGVFIKTKEEQHDSNSLIGEFITKDDIDVGHIKQDDFEDPGFIENNDNNDDVVENNEAIVENNEANDFSWQDQNDYSDMELVQKLSSLYRVDTEFVRLEDLRMEMEEKRNSGKYKVDDHGCELCCKQYNFLETYKRHMNRNHNPDWEIECDICRYRFKTQRDFLAHIMMHARIIKCQDCNALIPSKWCDAKKHAECHRGVVHTCTICNQTFTRKKSLSMHLRAKHRSELEVVMCLLCGDTYNGEEGLRIHIRCIHKTAAQCHTCGVWFDSADILAAHTRPETGGCQPHRSACPMCGANFDNLDTMLEHHKQLHPMYKCAECKITFESGKICVHFKYNHNLVKGKMKVPKRRSRLYNKDIICEVCGKNNFTCVATLKIHQRIHTGERPYTCEICQKTFRMRSDLKLHSAIHTGERSYKCPYCPRAFRQPPHLKSHLPTHTKEKAYECEICHKRFTQRANMQEHVRTIHEGLPPKRRQRHSKMFEA
ncbi:hypothetical protein NE865_07778 [Phthorimaea operculella]|nr:hypothetical protein NE865_07778 [Phthorimaea operculella]